MNEPTQQHKHTRIHGTRCLLHTLLIDILGDNTVVVGDKRIAAILNIHLGQGHVKNYVCFVGQLVDNRTLLTRYVVEID